MVTTDGFVDYMTNELGLSDNTICAYIYDVRQFLNFIRDKSITATVIEDFINELRKLNLKETSLRRKYMSVRCFCHHLISLGYLDANILKAIDSVRISRRTPNVLDVKDMDALMATMGRDLPAWRKSNIRRNVAIVLILYRSGLRVSELCALDIDDVDFVRRTILVHGKGKKDRVVPTTHECIAAIKTYLNEERNDNSNALFVNTKNHQRITRRAVSDMLLLLSRQAGVKHTTAHTLRGSCATGLLNSGVELDLVQALLGHTRLETTQTYLAVSTEKLIAVHRKYHPTGETNEIWKEVV